MSGVAAGSGERLPRGAIIGLAVTQMIGWGSTYYIPSVLAPALRGSLDLSQQMVFGGITIMLLVSAAVAPTAGRILQERGVREPMMLGSALLASALLILAQAEGLASYALAWVVIGLAAPVALSQGAMSAMAQIAGPNARRALSTMLLLSGFSSGVFWPLTAWLDGAVGWRSTCVIFAALNLLVCLPIHSLVVPKKPRRPAGTESAVTMDEGAAPRLRPEREAAALVLVALAFSLGGFVSWGLPLQLVELLAAFGHPAATSVAIAAIMGPAQVAARIGEVAFGHRAGIMTVAQAAAWLMPFAVLVPLIDTRSAPLAAAFVIGYGLSAGAMTIVRSVLPLMLFGRARYAKLLGQLFLPQNIAFALSPLVFASVMSAYGPRGVLLLSFATASLALAAMIGLVAMVRRSGVDGEP
jgi:predicted MFS family arabinose efflux permease